MIFSTYTHELVGSLKGHSGVVKSIRWTTDDLGMVSAGLDGAVYEWRVAGRERVFDHVLKSCQYEAVTAGPGTKNRTAVVAAGRDGTLREIVQGNVAHEARPESRVTQLALSSSDRLLFAGTQGGGVQIFGWPFEAGECLQHLQVHCAPITRMCLAHDESCLFTASEDGQVFTTKQN